MVVYIIYCTGMLFDLVALRCGTEGEQTYFSPEIDTMYLQFGVTPVLEETGTDPILFIKVSDHICV